MALIRQKKKNLIASALIGAVAAIIPLGAVLFGVWGKYISLDKKYNEWRREYKKYTVYVASEDKGKGDILETNELNTVTFYSKEIISDTDSKNVKRGILRQDITEGMLVTSSMVYEDTGIEDNLRTYMFDYIQIPDSVKKGDVFDIRISFPNGEDYIVAVGKTIQDRTDTGVFINATEKELLMISSAYVDTTIYRGAKIYASIYVTGYQEMSVVNYPVNMYVTELSDWNPNIVEELKEFSDTEKRHKLESNLYEFMGTYMGSGEMEEE